MVYLFSKKKNTYFVVNFFEKVNVLKLYFHDFIQ